MPSHLTFHIPIPKYMSLELLMNLKRVILPQNML